MKRRTNKSKTPEELLRNTIYGYTLLTRANTGANGSGACKYWKKSTNISCAIGRELTLKMCKELDSKIHPYYLSANEITYPKESALAKMDPMFLVRVQSLHLV